jgi:hypothetical protein
MNQNDFSTLINDHKNWNILGLDPLNRLKVAKYPSEGLKIFEILAEISFGNKKFFKLIKQILINTIGNFFNYFFSTFVLPFPFDYDFRVLVIILRNAFSFLN